MTSPSFDLDSPDHFTAGAVGPPGERVFYLQGRQAGRLVTLRCEKEQVRALATHLASLVDRLGGAGGEPAGDLALAEPIQEAWRVGTLAIGYDDARRRVVIVANELVEEEGGGETASARFAITHAQAAAFVERADELMKAGRPICPLCSQPRDPGGHVCPRENGHVVH